MSELEKIQELEHELIYLARNYAPKQEVGNKLTEMMSATKKYLGETNSYFDEMNDTNRVVVYKD